MNFDDDKGQQRPIVGTDSIDQKIAASPSPSYALGGTDHQSTNRDSSASAADNNDGDGDTIDTVFDADVLCGRGKTSFNHPGNKRFRDLISGSMSEYDRADSRLEKSLVVHSIVESIRTVGGRFLKPDQASGKWRELSDRACREKVGHAIRDAATIIQARRSRKKQLQSQNSMSSSLIMPSRGPISRYAEMKSDTPDPVSFHDMARFSNVMMPGLPSNTGLHNRSLGPAEGMPNAGSGAFQTSFLSPPYIGQDQANGSGGRTDEDPDLHPSDEADFMAQIDQVLGPMPPNHDKDPLAEILDML